MPEGRKGKIIPRIFEENHGLRQAWFGAWYPKPDDEYCIIIEDDLEVSPFWYTWLKKAWLNYGNRTDMAGIALQVIYYLLMHFFLHKIKIFFKKNKFQVCAVNVRWITFF